MDLEQKQTAVYSVIYECISLFASDKWVRAAYPNYCSTGTSTPPTVANANVPAPYTTIGSVTYFTCLPGYQASGASLAPFYTCDHSSATVGAFSSATGTCVGTLVELVLRKFSKHLQLLFRASSIGAH